MSHALTPTPNPVVFVPIEDLQAIIDTCVQKAIREKQQEELMEKFLSPEETRKLFVPAVSLVTLNDWANKGYINRHRLGGRVWYKYGEIIESAKTLKKFSRDKVAA
ncbi:hypothetical protein [Flaviaesturariibacter amylovorans]|uniref:DNA-binding protein n=1 Tax=Flaviaesturariibacter amylovorans TaxID=1084520 RepID=A0ABP8GP91_9BACT